MFFEVIKVATCGCEILNENNQVIGWSVDEKWGRIMSDALLSYFKMEQENGQKDDSDEFVFNATTI